jgi:hypothetical protein
VETTFQHTLSRIKKLRDAEFTVVEKWGCEFASDIRTNPELAEFVENLGDISDPLDPREALRGGRTNAVILLRECQEGERMSYIDVCSLYPWGVKYGEFPVGHPEIITEEFEPISKDSKPYFGLIKCKVLPPRVLHHPVLPYFSGGKLLFPLCKTCAEEMRQDYCDHTDEKRALSGTWVTTELYKALDLGYTIVSVDEIWHYKEREKYDGNDSNTGLFTRYIDCFLKLKIQASGWPGWVQTEEDKTAFLQQCKDREGFDLDRTKIKKNAGLRSLAKLCLNSFWGKFGQRTQVTDSEFVAEPVKFNRILFDESNVVHQVRILSENVLYVSYSKKDAFVDGMIYSNPVLAAFVTAICRLRLYSDLEKLGDRVAYFDTDSIIYVTRPGDEYEPPLGSFLGDMTSEIAEYGDKAYIDLFVSGGPKHYAYRVRKEDGSTVEKIKIRGFTLSHATANKLNLQTLVEKVADYVYRMNNEKKYTVVNQPRIARTENRAVVTRQAVKKHQIDYNKRWLLEDFTTNPYGTCA